jgi:hemolysin activation/secretion protein
VQLAQRVDWRDSQLVLRSAVQLAPEPLLALEKFAVGGHVTVRGYRENTFVRDNALIATAEMRIPAFLDEDGVRYINLDIVPFLDYGVAWNSGTGSQASDKDDIASIGLGLRWEPNPGLFIQADYGHALTTTQTPTETLQDRGFQFQINYTFGAGR